MFVFGFFKTYLLNVQQKMSDPQAVLNDLRRMNLVASSGDIDQMADALESALGTDVQYHYPQPGFAPPYYAPPPQPPQNMHMMRQEHMSGRPPLKYAEGMILKDMGRMKGWELAKLIKQQATAVQSGDDYSDDYYYLRHSENQYQHYESEQPHKIKPTDLLAEMDAVLHKNTFMPQQRHAAPLPLGAVPQVITGSEGLDKKTKEWHETNSVLGRSVKSNLKRPRELIALVAPPTLLDEESKEESVKVGSIGGTTFKSQTWVLRGILGQIASVLLEVEDIHRLLQAKVTALRSMASVSTGFQASQGIVRELQQKQFNLCDRLGVLLGFPSVMENGVCLEGKTVELVGGWDSLFFLIWTPKGRLLVLRSIPCLLQPHLRAILRNMCSYCAYFVCRNPDGQDDAPDAEAILDLKAASVFSDEFKELKDLDFVTECLKLTREVFQKSPQVLSVFVHIPAGQEIIRAILQHGKTLSLSEGVTQQWKSESDRFYKMMQEAVQSLEQA